MFYACLYMQQLKVFNLMQTMINEDKKTSKCNLISQKLVCQIILSSTLLD